MKNNKSNLIYKSTPFSYILTTLPFVYTFSGIIFFFTYKHQITVSFFFIAFSILITVIVIPYSLYNNWTIYLDEDVLFFKNSFNVMKERKLKEILEVRSNRGGYSIVFKNSSPISFVDLNRNKVKALITKLLETKIEGSNER
jgi:hypothetical protein